MKSESYFPADDEFQDLCFKFGLELDEVVSNKNFGLSHY